jgi:peptidyl-prolyl cis-trans isomerase D
MPARLAPKARLSIAFFSGTPMLSFFRRVTNSKIGTWVMAAILLAILAGFGLADLSNFGTGNIGLGAMGSSTLAQVGDQEVAEREVADAMQRRLQDVRQQNPAADYATIAGDFDVILGALIDQRALIAFADKFGFHLSKALIDAEIAQIPQVKGLNGKVSDQAYQAFLQQQKMTDAQVREIIGGGLLQRLLLTPVASNARLSVGMATPYASMMLESRQGDGVAIPLEPFKTGLKPAEAQVQQFYAANRNRYVVPEQRVLRFAAIGPEQVASITASDQEIAAEYNRNQATYGAKEIRSLSQAVVPDQATANAIAQRARGGASLAAAAAPAGANAAVTSLRDQTRQAYAGVAGDKVAAAVFSAAAGAVVGPLQSDFGWVVVKVDSANTEGGKSLAQARAEIASRLAADKRKAALEDMVDKLQDAVDAGHNFTEAAAAAKVPVTSTPLINASGIAPADPNFHLSPDYAPALKSGFEIAPSDQPEIVALASKQGYVMVAPAQVVPAAPAPLAKIHDQVVSDWINDQARRRAAAVAIGIAAKASSGMPLAEAVKAARIALPPVQPLAARRIQIAAQNGQVPAPLRLLFTLAQGKSRMLPDPGGRGFYVVKTNVIVPGNALLQPGLINRMQTELQQSVSQEYAQQFQAAVRVEMKARRNESAIAAEKAQLIHSGS